MVVPSFLENKLKVKRLCMNGASSADLSMGFSLRVGFGKKTIMNVSESSLGISEQLQSYGCESTINRKIILLHKIASVNHALQYI